MTDTTFGGYTAPEDDTPTPAPVSLGRDEYASGEIGSDSDHTSPFADLAAAAAIDLFAPKRFPVLARPGYELELTPTMTPAKYRAAQKLAAGGGKVNLDKVDQALLNAKLIADHNTGIFINGKPIKDEDGDPLTVSSEPFLKLFKTTTVREALIKFLGGEYRVIALGSALFTESGMGDDPEATDASPTGATSGG